MIDTLTLDILNQLNTCPMGIDWFKEQQETQSIAVLKSLIAQKYYEWAKWLIVRVMDYSQYVNLAIYSAEQVIDIYETKYPGDTSCRDSIEFAKKLLINKNETNRIDTRNISEGSKIIAINLKSSEEFYAKAAAWSATGAAWAASDYAWSQDWYSKDLQTSITENNDLAFWAAEWAISWAISTTNDSIIKEKLFNKILNYGIDLLV